MKYVTILSLMLAFTAYSPEASAQQSAQMPKEITVDLSQFGLPGKKLTIFNPKDCNTNACDQGIKKVAKTLEAQFKACEKNPNACNKIQIDVPACGKCKIMVK